MFAGALGQNVLTESFGENLKLSWRHFVVHDGVGHAAKLPHLGVKINEDGSHS